MSTHRPDLDRLLVQFAEAATGQQLQRICASFTTSDTEAVDTWAARDLSMRELKGGMSEIRVVLPTADAMAGFNALERRAEQLWREQHTAVKAAAADEPDGCGDAAASPEPAPVTPDPVGCRRADAFLEAVDALAVSVPADVSGQDRHLVVLHTTPAALEQPPAGQDRLVTVTDDAGCTPALSARVLRRLTCNGARHVTHDTDPIPPVQPLPGAVVPEAVFPEWPDEIDDVDPWQAWPPSPLTPTGAVARPDYDECLAVLWAELERHRQPAPEDIVIAA